MVLKVLDPVAITKVYSCSAYDLAYPDFTDYELGRPASQA